MSFLKRAHDIVQAKANRALDAAENPAEILDLNYEQMLEQITKVRAALVQIAAARKQLELQEEQFKHTIDHLDQQAAQAVQLGRDDLAREALSRKAAAQQQVETLEPQHQQLAEQEERMTHTLQALQTRVNQFRTQKEALKAQYSAAKASSAVNDQIAGISSTFSDSGAALQRARDKIAAAQAHAGALDELLQSGVLEDVGADQGDDISKQLNELGSSAQVEGELAALKAKAGLAAPPAPAALGPGGASSGSSSAGTLHAGEGGQ
jgi:phage shock protein A